ADREQAAQAARAGRSRRLDARDQRWLPARARARADQRGRHRGRDRRADRHDRVQRPQRRVRTRAALRRARELASHQPGDRGRARRRDPCRHDPATGEAQPRHPVARGERMSTGAPAMATAASHPETEARERATPLDLAGNAAVAEAINRRYEAGFVTDIESESLPPGLDEDVVRAISARKGEPAWMTEWRLQAYRHWLTMTPPHWARLEIAPI